MPSRLRLLVLISCVVIVSLSCLESVFSQVPHVPGVGGRSGGRNRPQQQQQSMQQQIQNLPPLQTTGVVERVYPEYGCISILSGQNQIMILKVLPTARCQVTGKAKPDALAPGYFVHFIAAVNKRGMVEDKITKITVFTPSDNRRVGADPDNGMGTAFGPRMGEEREKKKDEKKAKPAFGAAAADAAKVAAEAAARKGSGEVFDVRGQITKVTSGKIEVHVPNTYFRTTVRAEVAEDADIDVELDEPMYYTLARKGDKIEVQGRLAVGGDKGFAEQLDIVLSEPLASQDAKKGRGKAKSKRGADAEESADGKAEKKSGEGKAEKKDADASPKKKGDDAKEDSDTPEAKPKKKTTKKKAAATDDADK